MCDLTFNRNNLTGTSLIICPISNQIVLLFISKPISNNNVRPKRNSWKYSWTHSGFLAPWYIPIGNNNLFKRVKLIIEIIIDHTWL